jgi:hypothetical protein
LPLKKQFDVILNQYPRQTGKWQAWMNFKKLVQVGELPKTSKLLQIIKKNKMSQDWQRDNGRWIPGLSKFLKERRWALIMVWSKSKKYSIEDSCFAIATDYEKKIANRRRVINVRDRHGK